jgi:hypothetical protein
LHTLPQSRLRDAEETRRFLAVHERGWGLGGSGDLRADNISDTAKQPLLFFSFLPGLLCPSNALFLRMLSARFALAPLCRVTSSRDPPSLSF